MEPTQAFKPATVPFLNHESGNISRTELEYRYESVEAGKSAIRLFKLLSSSTWEEDVKCFMYSACMDEIPSYEAISYVWGDSKVTQRIFVNGHILSVTKNLATALRYMRRSTEPLVLWADAICIDQQNTEEKARQVSMMGEIYKACSRVYVCLGGSPEGDFRQRDPFVLVRHFADDKHIHALP